MIADLGMSFAQIDESGADAFIVSYLCKDGPYRSLFLNGIKPHVYIGLFFPQHWEKSFPAVKELANTPIPELKNHPDWAKFSKTVADSDNNPPETRYYYLYKQTCHSGNYGIMGPTFRENLLIKSAGKVAITTKQANEFIETYRCVAFKELLEFHRWIDMQILTTGRLRNLFGHPSHFTKLIVDPKEAYAFIPQSTVACITLNAAILFNDFVNENKIPAIILNQCHDSLLIQAPDSEINFLAKKVQEFIRVPLKAPREDLTIHMKSEASVGKNWGPFDEKKNPLGLKVI